MPYEFNGFGQYAPEAEIGLTKREHFAAMAMQGLLANETVVKAAMEIAGNEWEDTISSTSYDIANSLLNKFEQKGN